jgi:GYF domain 2
MKYSIARDGEAFGDFTPKQIKALLKKGEIYESDYFWTKGIKDWQPAASITRGMKERWIVKGRLLLRECLASCASWPGR